MELFANIMIYAVCSNNIKLINYTNVLILSSVLNYFMGKYVNHYEHKNKDNLAPINLNI